MVKHQCIPLESTSEWKEALEGIKHSFGETWDNCYAMHLTTGLKTYLYCFEKDNVRIVCPFTERKYDEYIDIVKPVGFSGFVGNGYCPEFPHYWKDFVKDRGYVCGYLGLNPIFDYSSHFDSKEVHQYDTIFVLDLTPSVDEILANMARKRRQQLNHWDDIISNFVLEKSALEEFFLETYFDFLRGRNAPSFYLFSKKTLSYLFSLDNVILVGAQNSGKVVSVVLFAYTSDIGDALFQASLPEGRHYSPALLWYGARHFKSLGIPAINFGGAGGITGIRDFKRRFGCSELPLRCLKQVYEPEIYEKLCGRAHVDTNDIMDYFPVYRKP